MSENSAVSKSRRFVGAVLKAIGEPSWVLFCFALVAIAFSALISQFQPLADAFETTQGALWSGAIVYVLVVGLVILPLWLRRGKKVVAETLGIDKRPTKELWWLPYVTWVAYMVTTILVGILVSRLFTWVDQSQEQDVGFTNLTHYYDYILAFIGLVILPPIAEELLFRGYLFGRLRQQFGFWFTAIVVSVTFGFVHGQWNVGIDTAVLSMFLCYLRERTGTIWASILLHAIKNGLAYYLLFIAPLRGFNLV